MDKKIGSTRFFILSFILTCSIFVIFSGGWVYSLFNGQEHLEEIVAEKEQEKLINKLKYIVDQRTLSILRMMISNDPFEIEEEFSHFYSMASEFVRTRDTLRNKYFDEIDNAQWKEIAENIKPAQINQRILREMLTQNKGSREERYKLYKNYSRYQEEIRKRLTLISNSSSIKVSKELQHARENNLLLTYVAIILSVLVIVGGYIFLSLLFNKIKRSENAFLDYSDKIRDLHDVSSQSGIDYDDQIMSMIIKGCQFVDMEHAFIVKSNHGAKNRKILYEFSRIKDLNNKQINTVIDKLCDFSNYSNNIITIPDISSSDFVKDDSFSVIGMKSCIATPFKVGGEFYGVLLFISKNSKKGGFSAEEEDLVNLISSWTGFSIERLLESKMQVRLKEQAESSNIAKSEFLGNMSHELRTPMHAILSYSGFGVKRFNNVDDDKKLSYFVKIQKSANTLLVLLNDILDLSKLEAGKMDFVMEVNDINELIIEIVDEFSALAQNENVIIECNLCAENSVFKFDVLRIKQVIRNLVSNAIKFSESGSLVIIKTTDNENYFTFSVIDEGVGVPDDELVDIFDKFKQSSKTSTGAGGTGLGLAISREIIHSHNGQIWAENNIENGAKFNFSIPNKVENSDYKLVS